MKPATLLKVTLFHECFSRFLISTNSTKWRKASHIQIWLEQIRNEFTRTSFQTAIETRNYLGPLASTAVEYFTNFCKKVLKLQAIDFNWFNWNFREKSSLGKCFKKPLHFSVPFLYLPQVGWYLDWEEGSIEINFLWKVIGRWFGESQSK